MDQRIMEKEIKCTVDTMYHCLTHFEQVDDASRKEMLAAGYTNEQIEEQLNRPGSKFYPGFATSPLEVLDKLRRESPVGMWNFPEPDSTGRIRLSFVLNGEIGTDAVVSTHALSEEELSTMHTEFRNGCLIRKVRVLRVVPTNECQVVLSAEENNYNIITLYPGIQAPPLPKNGESDPYWDNHCFVEY